MQVVRIKDKHYASLISESRGCPISKATEGEAVVVYRKPSATKEMGYHRLPHRVNKIDIKLQKSYLTVIRDIKNC